MRICAQGQWGDWGDCVEGDMGVSDAGMPTPDATVDVGVIDESESSATFLSHVQPDIIPGKFPASPCENIAHHHECVSTEGCGWLRTIKNDGVCREDPVARCLSSGECVCRAHDFHGVADHDADLEIFVPLSVVWKNLAPRTSALGGGG